jgi:hypothetical protein
MPQRFVAGYEENIELQGGLMKQKDLSWKHIAEILAQTSKLCKKIDLYVAPTTPESKYIFWMAKDIQAKLKGQF